MKATADSTDQTAENDSGAAEIVAVPTAVIDRDGKLRDLEVLLIGPQNLRGSTQREDIRYISRGGSAFTGGSDVGSGDSKGNKLKAEKEKTAAIATHEAAIAATTEDPTEDRDKGKEQRKGDEDG